jgi:uncharacterized repeat protein (TIGR03803 family)
MKINNTLRLVFLVAALASLTLAANAQKSIFQVVHVFSGQAESPTTPLIADAEGNLYGTTGGTAQNPLSTVYELSPVSGGGWSFQLLHVFKPEEGARPLGTLVMDSAGNLYGTTSRGGQGDLGTVFELSPSGGEWVENTIHDFVGDGFSPPAGLVFDAFGNLFGTAMNLSSQQGIAFELSPGSNGWTYNVIYPFHGNGSYASQTGMVFVDGDLYGASRSTIFLLKPYHGTWIEIVLHEFNSATEGNNPQGNLAVDNAGNLYLANGSGGKYNGGTILGTSSEGAPVIHSFGLGSDGNTPTGVSFDLSGNVYGTTQNGGTHNLGMAFKLASGRNGDWTETVLHDFTGDADGSNPGATLLLNSGNLFGTVMNGGAHGFGVLFQLAP